VIIIVAATAVFFLSKSTSKESFDPICSWKNPQSALISLDISYRDMEYDDTEAAKKACAADKQCTGVLSTTSGSTTTYKLTRTQPTVTNANENFRFIEKGMCREGTTNQLTVGNRELHESSAVVPSMSAGVNTAANEARLPLSGIVAVPPLGPPPMTQTPLSGVVAIPAVGPPPIPASSTLGTTAGQSGMLGTNPPGPRS
jgi:hypothetical protein